MDAMNCPRCGTEMASKAVGRSHVSQCPDGHGVFLDRTALGALADAENDWHRDQHAHHTAPLPRITTDMTSPPASPPRAGSWVETLFR